MCYQSSRMFGLSMEQKSFNFKMMQSLLPTRERLARIGKINSSDCLHCPLPTTHLLSCQLSTEVATPLLACLRSFHPNVSSEDITIFNIETPEPMLLPIAWLISTCLAYIWEERNKGKPALLSGLKAVLLSKINLLRDTKWRHYNLHNCAILVEELINLYFS